MPNSVSIASKSALLSMEAIAVGDVGIGAKTKTAGPVSHEWPETRNQRSVIVENMIALC